MQSGIDKTVNNYFMFQKKLFQHVCILVQCQRVFVTGNGMIRLFHLYRLNVQSFLGIYFYPFKIRYKNVQNCIVWIVILCAPEVTVSE